MFYGSKFAPQKKRFNITVILVLLLGLIPGFCFGRSADEPSPAWLMVIKDVGYFVPEYAMNLAAHESGHALLARVFDDKVDFQLRIGRIGLLEGLVSYDDDKIPLWYRPAISIAGSAFNRGIAELSDLALASGNIPYHLQPLFSEVSLVGRIDFPSNLANAFAIDVSQGFKNQASFNDFHNFVYFLSWDKSNFSKYVIYAGLFTLCGFDIYWQREKLATNWSVLGGSSYLKQHHHAFKQRRRDFGRHLSEVLREQKS